MKMTLITNVNNLSPALAASVPDAALPFAVTPHFAALARPDADDPIRRQFFPDPRELIPDPFALDDPLGEYRYRVAPGLIHQYPDRALLLAAHACAGYCRHCFRRVWLARPAPNSPNSITDDFDTELGAGAYLAARPEIREILVSGGDPLTLDNTALENLFRRLREARPGVALRVCTRIPITEPSRLDSATIALFAAFRPLRLAAHINHPRELACPAPNPANNNVFNSGDLTAGLGAGQALTACVEAGIPVLVQTVLLRGINDNAALLARLFSDCRDLGLSPYYLFQMDLAPGTAHFRVPLKQGLAIYRALSGLCPNPPPYALDLPGGGGKIRLHEGIIAGEAETPAGKAYILKDRTGGEWFYPAL